jgi:DNA-binding CsgD family transcriptional regulator
LIERHKNIPQSIWARDERETFTSNNAHPVVIAAGDGNVIALNKPARRMLGPGTGKPCWDVVGKLDDAEKLPCRSGCVLELLASGSNDSRHTRFKLGGKDHQLSCIPVNGVVICMLGSMDDKPSKVWPSLTPRERDILLLLADGENTSSVANQLGVSESTIRTHVERMRFKLRANTRAAVVAEGFRLGYLD